MAKHRLVIALAILALTAVACGNNDNTSGSSNTPPASSSSPSTSASPLVNKGTGDATTTTEKFEIELDNEGSSENYFKPTFIKVKSGQILTLELKNEGSNSHNFSITSLGIDKTIEPGKEDEVNITFPAAGGSDIQFFCKFHVSLGMRGAFFFGATPQTTSASSSGSGSGYGY
jgi:plastocyanin